MPESRLGHVQQDIMGLGADGALIAGPGGIEQSKRGADLRQAAGTDQDRLMVG